MPRGKKADQIKLDNARKNNVMAALLKRAITPHKDKPATKPPKGAA